MRPTFAALLLALTLAGCSAGTPPPEPPPALTEPSGSAGADTALQTFDDLSNEHREGPQTYDQTPPVGGPHHARWLACDAYDAAVPAEFAVHPMEHGAVWVTYRPDLPAEQVQELELLRELDEEYVLVSPYEGLPADVVVSTWGAQLEVDGADDPRLEQFVATYAGGAQGGEPGAPCRTQGLTPDEARAALAG